MNGGEALPLHVGARFFAADAARAKHHDGLCLQLRWQLGDGCGKIAEVIHADGQRVLERAEDGDVQRRPAAGEGENPVAAADTTAVNPAPVPNCETYDGSSIAGGQTTMCATPGKLMPWWSASGKAAR